MRTLGTHLLLLLAVSAASPLAASPNDLDLIGLVELDDAGNPQTRNSDFRSLVHELSVVMTPPPLQPAETTGQSGFDFGLDYAAHDISEGSSYWRDGTRGRLENRQTVPFLQTLGLRGRKGFPLPIPLSSEVDLGLQWIADSSLFSLGGNVRVALNEGFRWLPDIAVAGGANQLLGADDVNLTTLTLGGSVSKGFAISGSFTLTPFVGYQALLMNGTTRVLDPDPNNVEDISRNVVFQPVDILDPSNRIDRFSLGLRMNVALLQLTAGADFNQMPADTTETRRTMMQFGTRAGLYF
ncbi:MAG: hypothetical protein ACO3JL_11565 [Myxococcota bacterium]